MREKQRRGSRREAGYGNRTALGIEKKGGCFLFLGLDNMREKRHHPLSLYPLISHIPPWHVQQTLRTALCASNTNKREAAGYWQADILLPSPVCRTETRQGLGVWQDTHIHTSEDTPVRIGNKPIRADCLTQAALELLSNEDCRW